MKNDQAQTKKGPSRGLLGVVTGLVFVGGVLLSLMAPTQLDGSSLEIGNPEVIESVSATDSITPGEAIADTDTLDLQLD